MYTILAFLVLVSGSLRDSGKIFKTAAELIKPKIFCGVLKEEKETPSVVIVFGPVSTNDSFIILRRDRRIVDVFGRIKTDEQLKGIIESETVGGRATIYVMTDSNVELSALRDLAKRVSACKPSTVKVTISIDVVDK